MYETNKNENAKNDSDEIKQWVQTSLKISKRGKLDKVQVFFFSMVLVHL